MFGLNNILPNFMKIFIALIYIPFKTTCRCFVLFMQYSQNGYDLMIRFGQTAHIYKVSKKVFIFQWKKYYFLASDIESKRLFFLQLVKAERATNGTCTRGSSPIYFELGHSQLVLWSIIHTVQYVIGESKWNDNPSVTAHGEQ